MSGALHDDSIPTKSPPALAPSPRARRTIASSPASSPRGRPRLQNGGHSSDAHDHDKENESEAETVVLGDAHSVDGSAQEKKVIKREQYSPDGRSGDDAPRLHSIKEASNKPDSKDASRANGAKHTHEHHDRKSPVPTSPSSRTASRHTKETSPADSQRSPAQSAASPPQPSTRPRSASTTESRKRKLREEPHARSLEPPRQKAKTEGLKESRTHPNSPATVGRPHKRAQSIQTVFHGIPGRKRRDGTSLSITAERRDWSESSSERSSSPRRTHSAGLVSQARTKRSSRALASPARTMTHKRNVDKFGATRLARESEKGDLEAVRAAYDAAPDELNQEDFAGITPLQKAALHGYDDVVEFLLEKGCRTDCQSGDRDTPLIDAVENGHLEVVKLLLNEGHVNPHHANKKGQRAIDVLNREEDDYDEIKEVLEEAMKQRSEDTVKSDEYSQKGYAQPPPASRLLYNEYNTETLIEKAGDGDIAAVGELVASGVKPNIACGVAASRGGHYDVLSILLASGLKADYNPSKHSDTPMLVAIGRGHLRIVKLLLCNDEFDPTRENREGKTYWQLSEDRRGPQWQDERDMLKRAFDEYQGKRKSPQRRRKEAPNSSAIRKRKPSRERSASPHHETKRAHLVKSSTVPQLPQKSRRLMSGKDMAARRKRTVVSSDESSDDESEDDVRPPAKEPETKQRSYSDGEDAKPVKKTVVKSSDDRPRKRTERAHSEDSGHEDHPKPPKIRTRVVEVHRSKPTPTPDAESEHERKPVNKLLKSRVMEDKVKRRRPSDVSMDEGKVKSTPTPSAKSTPVPPEKAGTPEITRERRQEADRQAAEAKRRTAEEQTRLQEEQEAARKTAEEDSRKKAAADAETKRLADQAEAARKREEEEAQRVADEEAKRQESLVARQTRLSKLPRALRRACELGNNRPLHFSGEELGISAVFLPLFYTTSKELLPDEHKNAVSKSYIMSFQAVGILGLPELDLAHLNGPYSTWERIPVTRKQRELVLRQYDIALLAQDFRFPTEGMPDFDYSVIQEKIREARGQFLDMEGLYWIEDSVLYPEVEARETLQPLLSEIKDPERRRHLPVQELEADESNKSEKKHRPRKSFMDVVLEQSRNERERSKTRSERSRSRVNGNGNGVNDGTVKVNGEG